MSVSLTSLVMEMEFSGVGGGWTAVTADVRAAVPIRCHYGIDGHGITDRVAGVGRMSFALNNGADNSASTQGYYSPDHASVRSGFAIGIRCRLSLTYGGTTYRKFIGTLVSIQPTPGRYMGPWLTYCTVHDWMDEAYRTNVRRIAIQIGKRSDELFSALVANIQRQPVSQTIGTGADTYPYALDKSRDEGVSCWEEFQRVCLSEAGFTYVKGNTTNGGELVFETRTDRAAKNTNQSTFSDTMYALEIARNRDDIYNRVQVIVHPRQIDTANVVLYTLRDADVSDSTAIALGAGEVKSIVCPYTDPDDRFNRIGGTSVVTPVATTDYTMFANADGTGTNLTANLSIAITKGANAAFLELTNSGATAGYITFLQIRGLGIYDDIETAFEQTDNTSITSFGENLAVYDAVYQANPAFGDGASRYFLQLQKDQLTSVGSISIYGNDSNALMTAALVREPGERIGLAETMSGITTTTGFFIQSVDMEITAKEQVKVTWGLAPASTIEMWLLGTAGASEIGETTVLGF